MSEFSVGAIACEKEGHQFEYEREWYEGIPENMTKVTMYKCKRCWKTKEEKDSTSSSVWNHTLLGAGCNNCNGQVYIFEKKNGNDPYCRNCGKISWNSVHQY